MRTAGKVNWFNASRGFGFITPDGMGQLDCFVHHTAIRPGATRSLTEGERVEFDVVQWIRGPSAENVTRMSPAGGEEC
ncbi:MAG TPA: cold shock domain-containing protein [Gemmatimonadales bacterium]|jgi:CspA family cold shock protein|nr:cold shock domain-containing protein [Gemmatimonadales bacterium]